MLDVAKNMSRPLLTAPLTFEPVFMERIWGGRRLESEFGKKLPPHISIGESWEISDRPEAQSIVRNGPLKGKALHDLWTKHRPEIFGETPDSPRFPLLIKLLDARETLSLQVHPPQKIAATLGGEPKTEFWYVAAAEPDAKLFVGLSEPTTREVFAKSLEEGTIEGQVHTIGVKTGDAMFLPAGRFHAVGGGNLLVEIQQNSDTTYRVFDWNRLDDQGKPRKLHIEQALASIDFGDCRPVLIQPEGELLVSDPLFEIRKWNLKTGREITSKGQFAIGCCLTGRVSCARMNFEPGEFFLVPARLEQRKVKPAADGTTLLRVTIPV